MLQRLTLALAAVLALAATAAAQPDFSASKGEVMPAAPLAGDVVRHVMTISNRGAPAAFVAVASSLRRGFLVGTEGDCGAAQFAASGEMAWHSGPLDEGAVRRCVITVLTRQNAAGTLASVVTEIRAHPALYHRFESVAELGTAPDPNALAFGPVRIAPAGLVVLGLAGLFAVGAGWIALREHLAGRSAAADARRPRIASRIGAWGVVLIAAGFLLMFAALAHEDWRAYRDYRETRCTVFGSELDSFEHRSRPRRYDQSFAPVFALRYAVDGVVLLSSGYSTASALNFTTRAGAGSVFERFAIGTVHPCWYDPRQPQTVVLERGPGGAYVFALFPIPVLLMGWSALSGGRRRRRT